MTGAGWALTERTLPARQVLQQAGRGPDGLEEMVQAKVYSGGRFTEGEVV